MNKDKLLEITVENFEESLGLISSLKSAIKLNNSFLEMLFNAIPSPIFYKDKDGIYLNCNDAFSKNILGIPKEEIIGKSLYEFPNKIPKENADIYYQKDNELLEKKEVQFYTAKVKCFDNIERYFNFYKAVFIDDDEALGIIGIMMDISESEKQKEELKYLASVDSLTNLYNRRYFYEVVEPILDLALRNKTKSSVLMFDIDRFKNINDKYGHRIGDDTLIFLSSLLKKESRKSDINCRWGGEEFIMFLPNTDSNGAIVIAEKLRKVIENSSISLENNKELKFTVSIGVSEVAEIDKSIDNTIDRADKALHKAKESGRNKVCIK